MELFSQIEKKKPNLSVVLVGKAASNEEKKIVHEYEEIGRLKRSPTLKY